MNETQMLALRLRNWREQLLRAQRICTICYLPDAECGGHYAAFQQAKKESMSDQSVEVDFCKNATHNWVATGKPCLTCKRPVPTVIQTLCWAATTLAGKNAEFKNMKERAEKAEAELEKIRAKT